MSFAYLTFTCIACVNCLYTFFISMAIPQIKPLLDITPNLELTSNLDVNPTVYRVVIASYRFRLLESPGFSVVPTVTGVVDSLHRRGYKYVYRRWYRYV